LTGFCLARPMSKNASHRAPLAIPILFACTALLTACGGSTTPSPAQTAPATAPSAEVQAENLKTVDSIIAIANNLQDLVDGPGKVRFDNLIVKAGKPVDFDVFWGPVSKGEKAATVKYGTVSDYLTPRKLSGATGAKFTVTMAGSNEVLTELETSDLQANDHETQVLAVDANGLFRQAVPEIAAKPYDDKPLFLPAVAGKVGLRWVPLNPDFLGIGDKNMVVDANGTCITNGTQVATADGSSDFDNTSIQVPAGATLTLELYDLQKCTGKTMSAPVTAPASGNATLVAYLDASGKAALQVLAIPAEK
jgi:hypothetical protein